MATEKARWSISVDDDMLEAIEKFRYENKISTKSGATVELVRLGLEDLLREMEEQQGKKNKAPTAEDAAEAIRTILYYQYNREPNAKEIESFGNILPVIVNGVKSE